MKTDKQDNTMDPTTSNENKKEQKKTPNKEDPTKKITEKNKEKTSNPTQKVIVKNLIQQKNYTDTLEELAVDVNNIIIKNTKKQKPKETARRSYSPQTLDKKLCIGGIETLPTPNRNNQQKIFESQYFNETERKIARKEQEEFLKLPDMNELQKRKTQIERTTNTTIPQISPRLLNKRTSFATAMDIDNNQPFQYPKETIPLKALIQKRTENVTGISNRYESVSESDDEEEDPTWPEKGEAKRKRAIARRTTTNSQNKRQAIEHQGSPTRQETIRARDNNFTSTTRAAKRNRPPPIVLQGIITDLAQLRKNIQENCKVTKTRY